MVNKTEIKLNKKIFLGILFLINVIPVLAQNNGGIIDHLNYLAHKITTEHQPPKTLSKWQEKRAELKEKVLNIMGLNPMSEKTPLNVQYVGAKVDLGNCYFQRVVFESRPKVYVAAHLYIPKNVTFPVPAVIHVPGHGRRDKYSPHPRTYAENGFVAIGLPMVGEEGKKATGWGVCGEKGPYVGHFNWYNTGYSAIAPTVWDGIRAVDFLLTLKDSNDVNLVDENKIGMAGLSGGSIRTLWTTIAEPRISCAVVDEGLTAIDKYNTPRGLEYTCDIHIFYNYYGLSYAEMYSLIAPRAFLLQLGTEDNLYPNPQPVVNYIKEIYKLYGKPDNFKSKYFAQGHGYSNNIWNGENNWMDKWLRNGSSPLQIYSDRFETELTCFPNGEPQDMANTEELYTKPTPVWNINNINDFRTYKDSLTKALKEEILPTAFTDIDVQLETINKEDFDDYYVEEKKLKIDESSLTLKAYYFVKKNFKKNKTVIFLDKKFQSKASFEQLYIDNFLNNNFNMLYVEITGTGHKRWLNSDRFMYDRFAQLVGYTHASLQIKDVLAAIKILKLENNVDTTEIYLYGKDNLSVPALYSAVVDSNIAGIILENGKDKHIGITPIENSHCETAVFNILKYADIPQIAGLIYPRKIFLFGTIKSGFNWTKSLYNNLGVSENFNDTGLVLNEILESIDKPTSIKKNDKTIPDGYLLNVYPNPFNPTTNIDFNLQKSGNVKITIYDILGKKIKELVNKKYNSGKYTLQWDGKDIYGNSVSAGIYLVNFNSGNFYKKIKIVLLK